MNFIIDLSLNKRNKQIYDFILIIINYYIKYFKYISTKKKLNDEAINESIIWWNIF
jgi:hypothetical protein